MAGWRRPAAVTMACAAGYVRNVAAHSMITHAWPGARRSQTGRNTRATVDRPRKADPGRLTYASRACRVRGSRFRPGSFGFDREARGVRLRPGRQATRSVLR